MVLGTRFSVSIYNTEEEIDFVLEILPGIATSLRELSPFRSLEDVKAFGA